MQHCRLTLSQPTSFDGNIGFGFRRPLYLPLRLDSRFSSSSIGLLLLLRYNYLLTKQSDIVHKTLLHDQYGSPQCQLKHYCHCELTEDILGYLNDAKHAAKNRVQLALKISNVSNLLERLNYCINEASPGNE